MNYNDEIATLHDQNASIAKEIEAMREDQNYRFREHERRNNAENASRIEKLKYNETSTYSPESIRGYERMGLEEGIRNRDNPNQNSTATDIFVLLVFIVIVGLAISTFVR